MDNVLVIYTDMNESDKQEVLTFLRSHQLMALSTVSPIGAPESSVLYMYVDDEFNTYCLTREATRKYVNVMSNDMASIITVDEDSVEVAEITGRASVVYDEDEIARVTEELHKIVAVRKSEYWLPPVDQIDGDVYVLIKVVPTMVKYVDYADVTKNMKAQPKYITFNFASQE